MILDAAAPSVIEDATNNDLIYIILGIIVVLSIIGIMMFCNKRRRVK